MAGDVSNPLAAGEFTDEKTATPWLREKEIAKTGCVCFLTSSSVGVTKVVPYPWDHMLLEVKSTHQHLFPQALARLSCGMSISHAISLNIVFALLILRLTRYRTFLLHL